jgi:hypothetical protein
MFGAQLVHSDGANKDQAWYKRWMRVINLHRQQYMLPGGSIGREFIDLLAEEIDLLSKGQTKSEQLIVLTSVILQRDSCVRKACDIRRLLKRRILLWRGGNYEELVQEAERCDRQLRKVHKPNNNTEEDHLIRVFTKLMLGGKVREAVRWITARDRGGVLHPDSLIGSGNTTKTILQVLQDKHPAQQEPHETVLHEMNIQNIPLMVEVDITSSHVETAARKIHGGAGPGGCDSSQWQDFLLRFGAHSERLRDNVAALARRLTNSIIEWEDIRALMANRLVALDKCPGVRPIGIGECLRRILGKCLVLATGKDVEEVCNAEQLCTGVQAGIEGAIHAMRDLYDTNVNNGWGMLLVDASNAFNSINRKTALMNARIQWPRCSRFLFNTYKGHSALKVQDATELLYSQEGVTQGDPLSMLMYALAVMPLIQSLKEVSDVTQNWYADDAAAVGKLEDLAHWLRSLMLKGPAYGYFPEPAKSYLIVAPEFVEQAKEVFEQFGVNVVSGQRFLGGFIGNETEKEIHIRKKVANWSANVKRLAEVALSQPQAAFAALTKSLQFEWSYCQRVIPACSELFTPLEDALKDIFLPACIGHEVSHNDRIVFSLPARNGGLGIRNPILTATKAFETSQCATKTVTDAIKGKTRYKAIEHSKQIRGTRIKMKEFQREEDAATLEAVLTMFEPSQRRAIRRISEEKTSSWLTVLPDARNHFDLSATEFRDALSLRYRRPLLTVPTFCDGCGQSFDISHALKCKRGGLIIVRHNEVRDAVGDLANLVWSNVHREPIVREANDCLGLPALVADLGVRGVWQPQDLALFDIRVIDTDATSYVARQVRAVLADAEVAKKRKYATACAERRAAFTPFVTSVDGALGKEAKTFLRRLTEKLSEKWKRPHSEVVHWTRTRLSFAILRATSHCLRGTRTKWRSLGIDDGASIRPALD